VKRCKYEWESWRNGKVVATGCVASLKAAKALARRRRATIDVYQSDPRTPGSTWLRWTVQPSGAVSRP